MRTTDILLNTFEEIKILYQYLYISPSHSVKVNNGLCDLVISMRDDLGFQAINMNFPEQPLDYTDSMHIPNMEGIIDYLKRVPATEYPESFNNRWEEIVTITHSTISLNKFNSRAHKEADQIYATD